MNGQYDDERQLGQIFGFLQISLHTADIMDGLDKHAEMLRLRTR